MRHRLKILGLVLSLCCSFLVHAQTPGMVYQATLLHPQGVSMPGENIILEHLRHQKVSIRFSITDASLDVVYTEEHSSTTNAYGEVKIELGSGVAVFGDFQDILWNGDDKQLNVEIDYGWGTGYELFHTQSMYYLPHPLNPFDQERVSSNTDLLNYIIEGAGFDPYANYISKPLDSILENAFSLAESDRDLDEAVHENTESIASFKDDQKIEHLSLSDMRLQIALEGSDDFYVNLSSLRDGIGTDAQKASDVTLVVEGWMTKSDVEIKNLQSAIIQLNEDLDRLNNNNSDEQTMSLDGEELQLTGSQTSVLLRNYLNQVDRQKAQEVLLVETMDFDADGASEATVEEALIALSNRLSMGCTDSSACNYFSLAKADDGSCIFLMDCQTCSGETNGKGRVVENFKDDCGVCDGDNTSCADCAGVPNGSSWESDCGCVAEGNSGDDCDDCTGVPNGTASPDACGVCEGNGPLNNADCDGNCLPGFTDVNGVCVTVEEGCMESIACNYNSSVNTDDGSCIYNDEFSKDEISCDAYTWNGKVITESGTHVDTLQTTSGCDSVVTLNLTINESIRTTDTQEHCDAYTWIDGLEYTADNATATHTLKTTSGCDSVVALNLTINESIRTTDTQEHCDAYTWIDGLEYTADNATATHTLKTTSGCDSVVALNLTINESIRTTDTQEHCDAYTWIDGLEYTADNATATHTLKTTSGCDSVVSLKLLINKKSDDCDICVAGKFESSDTDNDGVCDEDEIEGCTNTNACNYNSSATESVECDYTKTYWKDEDGDESGYGDGVSLCLDEVKDGYVSHCSTLSAMYCFDDSCDKNYKINKSSFPLWSYPHGVSYNTNIFTCSGDFIDNNDHGAGVRVFSLGKVNGIHEKVYAFSVSNESYYKFYNSTALNYSASVSSKVYTNTWELPTEDWITEFRNDVKAQVFWDYVPTEFWTDIPCAGGYEIYNKDAKTYSCSDNSNAYPYIRIIEIKPNY